MEAAELGEKTGRLARRIAELGFDAVLLNSQHNFAWLTGGGINGVDASTVNGVVSLLVTREGQRFLLANEIEMPRMLAEEVSSRDFAPAAFPWTEEKAAPDALIVKARQLLSGTGSVASDVALGGTDGVIDGEIARCRGSLTPAEIERYRALGRDAGMAVRKAIDKFQPGETERQIAEKMRHELALLGMASVVTLVAADKRIARFRHPVPTENRWDKVLMVVTCAKRGGLIASLTRFVCVGEPSADLVQRTEAAAYVNASLMDATRVGATGAKLYAVAANAYAEKGFADEIEFHHQGGAAGYRTRDWVAHPQSTDVVQANQAFAWNPSITGTKVEETCILGGDGVELITASPDFPQIPIMVGGREYLSPGILVV